MLNAATLLTCNILERSKNGLPGNMRMSFRASSPVLLPSRYPVAQNDRSSDDIFDPLDTLSHDDGVLSSDGRAPQKTPDSVTNPHNGKSVTELSDIYCCCFPQ